MLNKAKIEKNAKGFTVKPTPEYIAKQQREQRMKERKEKNDVSRTTNAEIFEFLQDVADRQSEIYDLLRSKNK